MDRLDTYRRANLVEFLGEVKSRDVNNEIAALKPSHPTLEKDPKLRKYCLLHYNGHIETPLYNKWPAHEGKVSDIVN